QQQRIVAGVGVERGEDLAEVDVRIGRTGSERAAIGQRAGAPSSGLERQVQALQRRAGSQQHGRIAVDRCVLLEDVHGHDRATVAEGYSTDIADLDAGDVDRLALSGGDRGSRGKLRLDGVVALTEGERRLSTEDVADDDDRQHDQGDDRGEIAAMDGYRAPHGAPPVVTVLRLGAWFTKHGTLRRTGGAPPGQAGRVPSGG